MAGNDHNDSKCCFQEWMSLQEQDLGELVESLTLRANNNVSDEEESLNQLTEKSIKYFQEYIDKRTELAHKDVSSLFVPTWCSTLENSLLWIAGCKPSAFVRLVYALCGSQIESRITEFLQGVRRGNLGELTSRQLVMIDNLHGKIIEGEEILTTQLASLQEHIVDQPIAVLSKGLSKVGEANGEVEQALDQHEKGMVISILKEADKLRLGTHTELIDILTPVQAVDFLATSKKLHLNLHQWGKIRDNKHGRDI
ncbi:DOG1 domain-containing protein [Cephalotus follicularis]|uniref:DOG1 domain-containing protein n=1 Tax=Cephalotus follicularis TaxID=3775 RepID=A0A1Q3BIX6_CEPFO|nr:DOG1 domain-containing protein [Cephalotus follicularis]